MQIKVLIDNTPHPVHPYATEHGLSICFEVGQQRWLLDMGASRLFAANASRMGCDIATMDYAVISHAHADHSGGLDTFLNANDHAPVILSSAISDDHYYSHRINIKRHIGIDIELVNNDPDRFLHESGNRWINENVAIVGDILSNHPLPKGRSNTFSWG